MFGFSWCMSIVLLVSSICYVIGKPGKPDSLPGPPGLFSDLSEEQIVKCVEESGLTEDEMKAEMMKEPKEKSDKVLCVMKCFIEARGEIGKDGKLDIDLIKSHYPPHLKDQDTVTSCLETVDAISTCQDMEKVFKCFPHHMKN